MRSEGSEVRGEGSEVIPLTSDPSPLTPTGDVMARFFNIAGPCRPEIHYMIDPLPRVSGVRELIENQNFFVIHGPRQTGKTTYLYALMHRLNADGRFSALTVNIQPAAGTRDSAHAMMMIAEAIYHKARRHLPEKEWPDMPDFSDQESLSRGQLQRYLNMWAEKNPKPAVLFIDEADTLPEPVFSFLLRQLIAGFEDRPHGFPHSVILTGVRDIRSYRFQKKKQDQQTVPRDSGNIAALPFDIKAESFFMGGFTPAETAALLDRHSKVSGQIFPPEIKAEIFRLTRGQPWLVNALARQIVTGVLKNDYSRPVTFAHITEARRELIRRRDTHLENLADRLKEPAVKAVTEAVISGEFLEPGKLRDDLTRVQEIGLVTREPPVKFANPIYAETVFRALNYSCQISFNSDMANPGRYIKSGRLLMDSLLSVFQEFYRRHAEAWLEKFDFREIGRQLLLMAFLQRIIGSSGVIECETAVGSGRCEVLVLFGSECFALLLKLQRDSYSEQEGLAELVRYLNRLGQDQGYLVLFETGSPIPWEKHTYRIASQIPWEKRIFRKEAVIEGKRVILIGL